MRKNVKSKKIVITGGAGFIGTNLVLYFLKHHPTYKIINIDKMTYAGKIKNLEFAQTFYGNSRHLFIKMDINNPEIENWIKGADMVINLAAESHVDNAIKSADDFIHSNIAGVHNLLKIITKHNVRFHQVSTDEVFGHLQLDQESKFNEDTPYNPRNPYAATKASADHLIMSFYHTHNSPITISYCSNNYGPFQDIEKFIPKTITNIIKKKKVPVYGNGENIRDWIYVEDHCSAIDTIVHNSIIGQRYCIGGNESDINNKEIVKTIVKEMGRKKSVIKYVKDRPGHDLKYAMSFNKLNHDFGWSPKESFKGGIKKTILFYQEMPEWWGNY